MNEQTDNQINKPRPQTSKHTNTQTRKHTNTPTAKLTGRIGSPSQIHFIIMEAFQNILYDHLCFYRPLYHHLSPIYPHMGIADMRMEKGQERNLALNIHTVAVTDVRPMRCCPGAQKLDFIKLLDAGNSSLGKTCAQIGCSRHMLCAEKSLLSRVRDL